MTPWSQNFRLCVLPLFMLYVFSFMIYIFSLNRIFPDCLFKSNQRQAKFSILTVVCSLTMQCDARGTDFENTSACLSGFQIMKKIEAENLVTHSL